MIKITLSIIFLLNLFFCFGQSKLQSGYYTVSIINCGNETRIVKPESTVRAIKSLVYGSAEFRKTKIINFSSSIKVDTAGFLLNISRLKQTLPKNYFGILSGYAFSNEPNEDIIWISNNFIQILANGQIKVFSGYKITFEGSDPTSESFRSDPKIKNIQFLFTPLQLKDLEKRFTKLFLQKR